MWGKKSIEGEKTPLYCKVRAKRRVNTEKILETNKVVDKKEEERKENQIFGIGLPTLAASGHTGYLDAMSKSVRLVR